MLNRNFLTCTKAEIWDLTFCIVVNGEKSRRDLDLDRTMPNLKLVRSISSGLYHYFIELSCTQTDTHTDTHTDRHEYSIVAVDKPQL